MTESKVELGILPIPSTQIERRTLEDSRGSVVLRYTYYCEEELRQGGIEFSRRRAYRYRAESHCMQWYFSGVYDKVVEVENSEWVAELLEAMPPDMQEMFEMHHYMIYLDSSGCYEVVAASWRFLPETVVSDEE